VPRMGSEQILRYDENGFGAGIGYRKSYGLVVMGFPFETVVDSGVRRTLMRGVLRYLGLSTY